MGKQIKIAIIGYSGSGKSTLARKLGNKYDVPVLHLDTVHWLAGWKERDKQESRDILATFLDNNASWVIDGNYGKLFYDRRMEEADKIIFMNFNRFTCFYRAWARYFKYRGKTRESITEGCEEKIDLDFVWWILHEGRNKCHKKRYRSVLEKYNDKIIVIKNQKQLSKIDK